MSSQFFSMFSFISLVLGRPDRSSSSTDTQLAFRRECHSKELLFGLKNVTKPYKAFNSFSSRHVARFCHPHRPNETQSQKSTSVKTVHVHSVVPHGRLME
jgi:hypothetical protein